jgi:hypothetical protein
MFGGSVLAVSSVLSNGDFQTGDFSGWTTFETSNGYANPYVVSFDTNGDSTATWSSQFEVGQKVYNSGVYDGGGGIFQIVSVPSGPWQASADIAIQNLIPLGLPNGDGGRFELIVDGIVEDVQTFGQIDYLQVIRSTLSASGDFATAGNYEIRIRVTRAHTLPGSLYAYVDNVVLEVGGDQTINIDIKPGSDPNSINLGSKGVIPVAILSSDDFDASTVDPLTVKLADAEVKVKGKSGNVGSLEDVNGDGLLDLVVQVYIEGLALTAGDIEAELTGETFGGIPIVGSDSIRVVPPQ